MQIEIVTSSLFSDSQVITECGKTIGSVLTEVATVRTELENSEDESLREIGHKLNTYAIHLEGLARNTGIMGSALEKAVKIYTGIETTLEDWTDDPEPVTPGIQDIGSVVKIDWKDLNNIIKIDAASQEGKTG